MAHQARIMYIECKSGGLAGPARIGMVIFSKSGQSLYYQGRRFQTLKGDGFKANYYDVETGEEYWKRIRNKSVSKRIDFPWCASLELQWLRSATSQSSNAGEARRVGPHANARPNSRRHR